MGSIVMTSQGERGPAPPSLGPAQRPHRRTRYDKAGVAGSQSSGVRPTGAVSPRLHEGAAGGSGRTGPLSLSGEKKVQRGACTSLCTRSNCLHHGCPLGGSVGAITHPRRVRWSISEFTSRLPPEPPVSVRQFHPNAAYPRWQALISGLSTAAAARRSFIHRHDPAPGAVRSGVTNVHRNPRICDHPPRLCRSDARYHNG